MKLFKQLSTMLLLFVVVTASAQSALVIELRDGSNATFLLAENPRVTFSGEQLSIVSSSAAMEFNRSDVKNWHFADTPSSVENITAEAKAKLENKILIIKNIEIKKIIFFLKFIKILPNKYQKYYTTKKDKKQ